jgi:hypothetical protein
MARRGRPRKSGGGHRLGRTASVLTALCAIGWPHAYGFWPNTTTVTLLACHPRRGSGNFGGTLPSLPPTESAGTPTASKRKTP